MVSKNETGSTPVTSSIIADFNYLIVLITMDDNKLVELNRIGYKIRRTCGICEYASLGNGGWGTCQKLVYRHGKHSVSTRQLSIHEAGGCLTDFKISEKKLATMGGFVELIEPDAS